MALLVSTGTVTHGQPTDANPEGATSVAEELHTAPLYRAYIGLLR